MVTWPWFQVSEVIPKRSSCDSNTLRAQYLESSWRFSNILLLWGSISYPSDSLASCFRRWPMGSLIIWLQPLQYPSWLAGHHANPGSTLGLFCKYALRLKLLEPSRHSISSLIRLLWLFSWIRVHSIFLSPTTVIKWHFDWQSS